MLDEARRAGARRRRSCRATRWSCRSPTARSTGSSRRTSTATSRGRARAVPRRGASRRPRAGRRRLGAPRAPSSRRGAPGADPERRLPLGGLQALLHGATASSRSSAAAKGAARGPLVRRRSLLTRRRSRTARSPRSSATTASAAPAPTPATRSSRCPSSSPRRAARVPLRPGARSRRGPGALPVARPRGPDAPPLARARRGRVLRDLLLRRRSPAATRAGLRRAAATARRHRASRSSARSGASGSCGCSGPRLIVTVGGLARRRLLGLDEPRRASAERYERDGATVVPLPHPSGASGWLNDPANRERGSREAAALVRVELAALRDGPRWLEFDGCSAALPPARSLRLLGFLRPYQDVGSSSRSSSRSARRRRRSRSSGVTGATSIDKAIKPHDTQLLWICVGADRRPRPRSRRGSWSAAGSSPAARRSASRWTCGSGLYSQLVRLSFGFYDRHQTGQLMSRATVDLQGVRFFLGYGLIFFFQNASRSSR